MHILSQNLFLAFNYDFTTCTTKFYKRKMSGILQIKYIYIFNQISPTDGFLKLTIRIADFNRELGKSTLLLSTIFADDFNSGKISMNRGKMGSFLYFINSLFYRKK